MRAYMIYRTILAIYRHGAVAMSTLAFWFLHNLTLRVCMAPESSRQLCNTEQSIYTYLHKLKGYVWDVYHCLE